MYVPILVEWKMSSYFSLAWCHIVICKQMFYGVIMYVTLFVVVYFRVVLLIYYFQNKFWK